MQQGSRPSIRDVSWPYPTCDEQPEGVHQNVALAAFDTLVRIEAANAATFRRLHRLAIHDDDRRTGGPTGLPSSLLALDAVSGLDHCGGDSIVHT